MAGCLCQAWQGAYAKHGRVPMPSMVDGRLPPTPSMGDDDRLPMPSIMAGCLHPTPSIWKGAYAKHMEGCLRQAWQGAYAKHGGWQVASNSKHGG